MLENAAQRTLEPAALQLTNFLPVCICSRGESGRPLGPKIWPSRRSFANGNFQWGLSVWDREAPQEERIAEHLQMTWYTKR